MALLLQVLKHMLNFTQVSSSIGANGIARLHKAKHMLHTRGMGPKGSVVLLPLKPKAKLPSVSKRTESDTKVRIGKTSEVI